MREIHVARQFFGASGPQGGFFEKTKKPFLYMVLILCVANLRSVSFFVVAKRRRTDRHTEPHIYK